MEEIHLTGKVILQKFGAGSKSDHESVSLDTGDAVYKLVRRGGNPFHDEILLSLVGKTIRAAGTVNKYIFEISDTETEII